MAKEAATSFDHGVFHVLPPEGSLSLATLNARRGWAEDWPGFEALVGFAYDWLGRLYVLEPAGDTATVARLEPEIGELTETGVSLTVFLNEFIVEDFDDVFATTLRAEYVASGRRLPNGTEVIGYLVPPFLGGSEAPENMAPIDLQVYLSLSGQLATKSTTLDAGHVEGVDLSR